MAKDRSEQRKRPILEWLRFFFTLSLIVLLLPFLGTLELYDTSEYIGFLFVAWVIMIVALIYIAYRLNQISDNENGGG